MSDVDMQAPSSSAICLYVDADACPVKDEVYRVAARYGLKVFVVANGYMALPREAFIERVVVENRPDAADDWIAERAGTRDVVITSDVPLAARCVERGAYVLTPTGHVFTPDNMGMALATRNLMDELRSSGETTRGPKAFAKKDRSNFLSSLDLAINRLNRR